MTDTRKIYPACPIPKSEYPFIVMAHGGGGRLMHQLIDKIFKPAFKDVALQAEHDGAILDTVKGKPVMTTDSYVVNPLFFPGGDIGKLAIYGTVNDLAMCGARPLYLSVGFILEEGLPVEDLWRVVLSMRDAAIEANIKIVTGDTKVVDRGKGDGIFINTAGIGVVEDQSLIAPSSIGAGDAVIISGDIGRHGIAVMAGREGIELETDIESDCAPLYAPIRQLQKAGIDIHCLRDLTRGGLGSALVEIARSAGVRIEIEEEKIPVRDDVIAACELLGFDPLYIANEGRFVVFVPENQKDDVVRILRDDPICKNASIIGKISKRDDSRVVMKTLLGADRIVDMLSGEQLPRIC